MAKRTLDVNDLLFNRSVRRQVLLEQVKNGMVRERIADLNAKVLNRYLNRWEKLIDKLERSGSRSAIEKHKTLSKEVVKLRRFIDKGFDSYTKRTQDKLTKLAKDTASWQTGVIKEALPAEISMTTPSIAFLNAIVTSRPMEGRLLKDWFKGIGRQTQQRVTQAVNTGLANGESVPEIVRRLRGTRRNGYRDGVLNATRRHTETIVRTAANHVTTQAKDATYRANVSLLKGWLFVATLDDRTTLQCAALDGKTFDIGTGPMPPLHMACRSTSAPLVKGWKELGLKEPPASTRASMNGQVPDKTTYGKWLKGQPAKVQETVLGKSRAKLFRDGKLSIEKFTTDKGRVLTLKELGQLDKD